MFVRYKTSKFILFLKNVKKTVYILYIVFFIIFSVFFKLNIIYANVSTNNQGIRLNPINNIFDAKPTSKLTNLGKADRST
ncbi:MAG: hypothetical protein ACQBVK_01205, partial [Candidatus Phytoplasma sp. TWB_XP]